MRKLRLEDLAVLSFVTQAATPARGTVLGHEPTGGESCYPCVSHDGGQTCALGCPTLAPEITCQDSCYVCPTTGGTFQTAFACSIGCQSPSDPYHYCHTDGCTFPDMD